MTRTELAEFQELAKKFVEAVTLYMNAYEKEHKGDEWSYYKYDLEDFSYGGVLRVYLFKDSRDYYGDTLEKVVDVTLDDLSRVGCIDS